MAKHVTISDVAEQAGVSTGTVSAVINDKASVQEDTRAHVRQIIDDLGYQPSPSARDLGSYQPGLQSKSEKVGVIIKEIDNPFYADVVLGVRDRFQQEGYGVFVGTSEGEYTEEGTLIDGFRDRKLDGVIVAPVIDVQVDLTHLFSLRKSEYPFVMLEHIQGLRADVVSIDNVRATQLAARYLIENGHENIMHFAGPPYSKHTQDRIRGVRKAYSESNLRFTEDVIVSAGAHMEDGYETARAVLRDRSLSELPTAITCFNDLVAMGVLRAIAEAGLEVPEDISVVGCDDVQIANYLSVPLTTVRAPRRKMGRRAADLLLQQIEDDETKEPEHVVLESELVVRESTRAI